VLPVNGISAMPSVHVAVAVLFALAGGRAGRWPGRLFTAYAGIVLLGSVHLGWHYAVDGYVSAAIVAGLWLLSGPLATWYHERVCRGTGRARAGRTGTRWSSGA
jgi:PAP2 superfamily